MINRVSLDVTHRCNLKCKLCAIHAPYFEPAWHPSLEFLEKTIDRVFELAPMLNRLVFAGGEPLVRKDLWEVLKYCLKYIDKVEQRVEVITNGSILPTSQLLEVSRSFGNKIYYIVDYYGEALSPKLREFGELLKQNGIPHELRDYHDDPHCGGWVDFGDFSHKRDLNEAKRLFAKCSFPQKLNLCVKVFNGRVDPCSQSMHAMRLGLFDATDEYFDLFDDSISIDEKRCKVESWYTVDNFTACQYCDGMCDDSIRFAPAEQLRDEKLAPLKR
jgi:hypothetical protein